MIYLFPCIKKLFMTIYQCCKHFYYAAPNSFTSFKSMEMSCVSSKKYSGSKNSSTRRTKQNRLVLISNCSVCGKKKSRFIKYQEATRLELH